MSISSFFEGVVDSISPVAQTAAVIPPPTSQNPTPKSSPISLGDIDFDGFDVPENVKFGTRQALTVHKLIGGGRVVDANGADVPDITWSGIFLGADAEDRADRLKTMCDEAKVQTLAWGAFNYSVVIESVNFDYRRSSHIPYDIVCVVLETLPVTPADPSLSQVVTDDLRAASATGPAGEVATATKAVSGLLRGIQTLKAGTAQALAVVKQVQAIKAKVQNGIIEGNAIISGLSNIGTGSPSATIRQLNTAATALESVAKMSSTKGFTGRILSNMGR